MSIIAKVKIAIHGCYDLEVKHADGTSSFYPGNKNKIVDQGLDAYGGHFPSGYTGIGAAIIVGTGNTPPANTDTQMETPIALQSYVGPSLTGIDNATAPYMTGGSSVMTFGVGAVVGNIAEIGLTLQKGTNALTDAIFSRALILVGGLPGTITLTASDQLIVTYTITMTYAADTTGTINVTTDGTPAANDFTVRPYNLGNDNNGFQGKGLTIPITLVNTGLGTAALFSSATAFIATTATNMPNQSTCDSASAAAYTPGSFTRTVTAHWNTGHARSGTLFGINLTCMSFQVLFDNPVATTTLQTCDFTSQVTWASAT